MTASHRPATLRRRRETASRPMPVWRAAIRVPVSGSGVRVPGAWIMRARRHCLDHERPPGDERVTDHLDRITPRLGRSSAASPVPHGTTSLPTTSRKRLRPAAPHQFALGAALTCPNPAACAESRMEPPPAFGNDIHLAVPDANARLVVDEVDREVRARNDAISPGVVPLGEIR